MSVRWGKKLGCNEKWKIIIFLNFKENKTLVNARNISNIKSIKIVIAQNVLACNTFVLIFFKTKITWKNVLGIPYGTSTVYYCSSLTPVAAPGNRVNVPSRNPENLQRMGNSSRLSQQWESIVGKFSNFR